MWKKFGKPFKGYTLEDFKSFIEQASQSPDLIQNFFERFVEGNEDVFPILEEKLRLVGLTLIPSFSEDLLLHQFGIRTDDSKQIIQIHPESQAYQFLMLGDQILDFDLPNGGNLHLKLLRKGRELEQTILAESRSFFSVFKLKNESETTLQKAWRA